MKLTVGTLALLMASEAWRTDNDRFSRTLARWERQGYMYERKHDDSKEHKDDEKKCPPHCCDDGKDDEKKAPPCPPHCDGTNCEGKHDDGKHDDGKDDEKKCPPHCLEGRPGPPCPSHCTSHPISPTTVSPINPTIPVNPTGPTTTVSPVNPTIPVDPTGPTTTVSPVNPTQPIVGPTSPIDTTTAAPSLNVDCSNFFDSSGGTRCAAGDDPTVMPMVYGTDLTRDECHELCENETVDGCCDSAPYESAPDPGSTALERLIARWARQEDDVFRGLCMFLPGGTPENPGPDFPEQAMAVSCHAPTPEARVLDDLLMRLANDLDERAYRELRQAEMERDAQNYYERMMRQYDAGSYGRNADSGREARYHSGTQYRG